MTLQEKKDNLVKIAKDWYEGTSIPENELSDLEFDKLEEEILAEDPNWDYRAVIDSQGDTRDHYLPMPKVEKVKGILKTMEEVNKDLLSQGLTTLPKYDGGGLVLYYKDGKLYDALTRSSTISGKRQLSKVLTMVPATIKDHNITAIECEVVCDFKHGHGDLSRQAATGLLSSKDLQERCEKELTVVAIAVRFEDESKGNWVQSMKDLPCILKDGNYTFMPSPLSVGKYQGNKFYSDKLNCLIDGVVSYDSKENKAIAYKMYFNEMAVSKIIGIDYFITESSLKYVGKYKLLKCKVDGTSVSACSTGGAKLMFERRWGIGTEVTVIKAGLTIPQIYKSNNNTENDNFGLPFKCSCGTSIGKGDIANNGFFCPNAGCTEVESIYSLETFRNTGIMTSGQTDNKNILSNLEESVILDKYLCLPSFSDKVFKDSTCRKDLLLSGKLTLDEMKANYVLTGSQVSALEKTIPYFNNYITK